MKQETVNKLNGVGVILRFVTPFLVGVLVLMIGWLKGDIQYVKKLLENHLYHETAEIKERISRIETCVEMMTDNR